MTEQKLDQGWTLHVDETGEEVPAKVPGSVLSDLLAAGKLEDPYWRDNEMKTLKVMSGSFTFRNTFVPEAALLSCRRIVLHCEGLDTIAGISLNGEKAGSACNMHRTYEFPVKGLLKKGENVLEVHLSSAPDYIAEKFDKMPAEGSYECMRGFSQLRKAHYMFGWDWGPRIPDAGIWKNISLIGVEEGRLDSIYIRQIHEDGKVRLDFDVKVKDAAPEPAEACKGLTDADTEPAEAAAGEMDSARSSVLQYRVRITAPDGKVTEAGNSPREITIDDPKLWWPHGYGGQNLYTVKISLLSGDKVIDVWERRIGLRTMTVCHEKDQFGESFTHEVNGVKIFAMGADYIPEDNVIGHLNPARTRKLLEQCALANFNCIRVWGGGFYPFDYFYDICDELGLIVWQDCMFACAAYVLDDEMDENIQAEIRDNVRRLRHHASLGLWCGNNELEQLVGEGSYHASARQKADLLKIAEYIIPKIVKEEDPQTFYWPSSPSSGGSYDDPNSPDRGDTHFWEVWHGNRPFTEYRKHFFRYLSEFGFQSFPSGKTIESFTLPEDRNIFSYVMEKHQRNFSANGKIMSYMGQTFLYPTSLSALVYASQLLQAESIKYGVEHFRRNRGRCMGTIYWQLNDCWPVASWASIDYYGRWKALHYYAKRFYAPALLSCQEEGLLSQDPNVNAQPYDLKKSVTFNVSNETMTDRCFEIVWSVRKSDGSIVSEHREEVSVKALSAVWLDEAALPDLEINDEYVSYQLYEDGRLLSASSLILSLPRFFHYKDPKLTVRAEGDEIIVTADAYAKSVEIRNENDDLILSDNFFDMDGGEKRVKVLSGRTEGLRARSVYDIR